MEAGGWGRIALGLALMVVAACQGGPPAAPAQDDATARTRLAVGGRTYVFKTADGRPMAGLAVLVGGKRVELGGAGLPADLARQAAAKGLVLLADGYVPLRLAPGAGQVEVVLVPARPLGRTGAVPVRGGEVSGDGAAVTLGTGLLGRDGVAVDLAAYTPPLPPAEALATQQAEERRALAPLATTCDAPLPCQVAGTLGLLVRIDGPAGAGELVAARDLASMGEDPAAKRILATFAKLDASPDGAAWRKALSERFGLTLQGSLLRVRVALGKAAFSDGVARIEVAGSTLLGALVEVTVVSAVGTDLPDAPVNPGPSAGGSGATGGSGGAGGTGGAGGAGAAAGGTGAGRPVFAGVLCMASPPPGFEPPPGTDFESWLEAGLLGDAGGSLISDRGGSLITDNGAGLVSNHGAGVVSNAGGQLTGQTHLPVQPLFAKYRLLDFERIAWPGLVDVRAVSSFGLTSAWARNGIDNAYTIAPLPPSQRLLYLEGKAVAPDGGDFALWTICTAPGCRKVEASLDPATTAIAVLAREELRERRGSIEDLDETAFAADVQAAFRAMNAADAQAVLRGDQATIAARVRTILAGAGHTPRTLPHARVVTIAGGAGEGYADGSGAAARFDSPTDIAFDGDDMYVCDRDNDAIRIVGPNGATRTLLRAAGAFGRPRGIAARGGFIYVADGDNQQIKRVRIRDGAITTLAGSGATGFEDGPGDRARFARPLDVAVDGAGNVYVADADNNAIRRIRPDGTVTTIAGDGTRGFVDGAGRNARMFFPYSICMGPGNDLYVADCYNHAIRRIDLQSPTFEMKTVVGRGQMGFANGEPEIALLAAPAGIAADRAGNLYVSEYRGNRIRKILDAATAPRAVTLAGSATSGLADGVGMRAEFLHPRGLAVAPDGRVYVTDRDNHAIRRIDETP